MAEMNQKKSNGERLNIDSVYDLGKLDGIEFGEEITLHYRSSRKGGHEEVSRDVIYESHISEGWVGRLTAKDGDQTIEVDKEIAKKKAKPYLLSKGGQRVVRLGYLEGITVYSD